MSAQFYTYTHDKLVGDKWVPFYVGKGKGRRAYDKGRNKWHNRVTAKHQTRVSIWDKGLEEHVAFSRERELILFLRTEGVELTNLSDGGEGQTGYVHTEETKQKIAEKSRSWDRPKTLCDKIAERQRGENNSAKIPGIGDKISKRLIGRIWVTDGKNDKLIYLEDIPIGWIAGRTGGRNGDKSKFIGSTKGLRWVTNGAKNKRIHADLEIPQGWRLGRVTPWQ